MGNSTAANNQNNQKPNRIFTAKDTWERIQNLCGVGMTQKEIGEKLHLSQPQISKIKNGDSSIDIIGAYLNIAKQLNVSLDWLLTGEEFHKEETTTTKKELDPGEPVQTEKDIEDYTVTDICKAVIALSRFENVTIENTSLYLNYTENNLFHDHRYYPSSITIRITPKTYHIIYDEGPGINYDIEAWMEHNYRDIYVTDQDSVILEIFLASLKNIYNMPLSDESRKIHLGLMLNETTKIDKRIMTNQFFLPSEYKSCGLCFRDKSFTQDSFNNEPILPISEWHGR